MNLLYLIICIYLIILLLYFNHISNNKLVYENYYNIKKKKIALCFLIYENIFHEQIWYDYLKNIDKNKYNIYIHYKINKPLKYFEKYKLNETIETCWGCLSIVLAQNLILKHALKDELNQHFIWLSDSCIPIKSFDYVYDYLNTSYSYFNIAPDEQVFPKCEPVTKFINKKNIKKAAMPSIICRKHAQLFVDNTKNIKKWFKDINVPDEIVYITLLFHNNLQNELVLTPNISVGSIIFTHWSDMSNSRHFENSKVTKKTPYNYIYICPEELNYLINSKSLFARKFLENCKGLTNLIKIINNKNYK